MNNTFKVEDSTGQLIFASTPGMKSSSNNVNSSAKRITSSTKKANKRSPIEFFENLAKEEEDPVWIERFLKMSLYKFPPNISWQTNPDNPDIYGEIMYKRRQFSEKLEIKKNEEYTLISENIKIFIKDYTNIEIDENNGVIDPETDFIVYPKDRISPIPWNKLSSKDQSILITNYIKTFGEENSLDKKQILDLIKYALLFAMGGNIFKYLTFDDNGAITSIANIYINSSGKYKLKYM